MAQNEQSGSQSSEDLLKAWTEQYYDRALNKGDMTVVADKVCIWWNWTGTFNGELRGIKPTGQFLTVQGASLLWVKDFKLISACALSDVYQVIGQLPLGD